MLAYPWLRFLKSLPFPGMGARIVMHFEADIPGKLLAMRGGKVIHYVPNLAEVDGPTRKGLESGEPIGIESGPSWDLIMKGCGFARSAPVSVSLPLGNVELHWIGRVRGNTVQEVYEILSENPKSILPQIQNIGPRIWSLLGPDLKPRPMNGATGSVLVSANIRQSLARTIGQAVNKAGALITNIYPNLLVALSWMMSAAGTDTHRILIHSSVTESFIAVIKDGELTYLRCFPNDDETMLVELVTEADEICTESGGENLQIDLLILNSTEDALTLPENMASRLNVWNVDSMAAATGIKADQMPDNVDSHFFLLHNALC